MAAPIHSFARVQSGSVLLSLKVVPRASRNEIGEVQGTELKIRVTAPPVDSAANAALIDFLAERLGCHRNQLLLVKGETSRHKTVRVQGSSLEEIARRLGVS